MIDKKVKGSMYEPYGIHKRVWDKYKKLVETKGYTNKLLKIEFGLNDIQIWFLFDKLLMGKYDYLYCRNKINKRMRLRTWISLQPKISCCILL